MNTIQIHGGKRLSGCVRIGGAKNAVLPILFATIVTGGVSTLSNLPRIGDVAVAIALLRELGATVEYPEEDTVRIDTRNLDFCEHAPALVASIRASTYLLGAELARFHKTRILNFGGCNFADRPIDMHLDAIRSFGGVISEREVHADALHGAHIAFRRISVGATVNALLLAAGAKGESRITAPATEPHVLALIDFLRLAGAEITVCENEFLVRAEKLHGADIRIIPDMIEAGTYLVGGLVTGGEVECTDVVTEHLAAFLKTLEEMGAEVTKTPTRVRVCARKRLSHTSIFTSPYPAFPTDLQSQLAALMAYQSGGEITERVFEARFGYLTELARFGVRYELVGATARIYPSVLHAADATATDLRGGAAALLLALSAEGKSRIHGAATVFRGYEYLVEKLAAIGAEISLT